jgi:hypothetical protein
LTICDPGRYQGPVVHLVEHLICNEELSGSSPLGSTSSKFDPGVLSGMPRSAIELKLVKQKLNEAFCSLKSEENFEKLIVEPYFLLIHADNGCLGVLSLRRTYVATIVTGELPRSADPVVSE